MNTKKPAAKKATPRRAPVKKVAPKKAPAKPRRMPPKTPLMLDGKHWDKPKVMAIVCGRIASSSKSLMSVLAEPHKGYPLPVISAVMEWLAADMQMAEQYARAKAEQADFMGEEFIELHQKAWVPLLVDEKPVMVEGKPLMIVSSSSAAAVKLEAENKKWLMGKLRPKKYGDKMDVNHGGSVGVFKQILDDLDGQDNGLPG
jgi:hypothetical protein